MKVICSIFTIGARGWVVELGLYKYTVSKGHNSRSGEIEELQPVFY